MTLVIDASALLDTMDTERPQCLDAFIELMAVHDCASPALVSWEVGNVMCSRRAHLFGKTPAERASKTHELLAGILLDAPRSASRAASAALAQAHGLTFYDAAYLELARRLEADVFVSHDEALLRAARKELRGRAVVRRLDETG